jgi:hypothetical protein
MSTICSTNRNNNSDLPMNAKCINILTSPATCTGACSPQMSCPKLVPLLTL